MKPVGKTPDDLEELITEALKTKPEKELSPSFTDLLLKKLERQVYWQDLWQEFAMKIGIVAGAILIIWLLLFFPARDIAGPFLKLLTMNWQIVTAGLILVLFTGFFDQVLLKYYHQES